jgi:hypothetical protein
MLQSASAAAVKMLQSALVPGKKKDVAVGVRKQKTETMMSKQPRSLQMLQLASEPDR